MKLVKDAEISIIVPVYNTKKYLEKCVISILMQTYENIQVILVDDGSTDGSGELCDYLEKQDKRIVVIHKKNGGLSEARNYGLDIARGKYIGFVDSDDYIEPMMYEKLLYAIETYNAELAECGVNLFDEKKRISYLKKENEIIEGKEALRRQLVAEGGNYIPRIAVWSKLFKKEFWKNKRFPVGKIHEDYFLTCQALYTSLKVVLVHEGLYNHLTSNSDSIMNSRFSKKDLYLEQQYKKRFDFLKYNNESQLYELAYKKYCVLLLSLAWRCNNCKMIEERNYYRKLIENNKSNIRKMKLNWKRKLEFELYFIAPQLEYFIRKFWAGKIRGNNR